MSSYEKHQQALSTLLELHKKVTLLTYQADKEDCWDKLIEEINAITTKIEQLKKDHPEASQEFEITIHGGNNTKDRITYYSIDDQERKRIQDEIEKRLKLIKHAQFMAEKYEDEKYLEKVSIYEQEIKDLKDQAAKIGK